MIDLVYVWLAEEAEGYETVVAIVTSTDEIEQGRARTKAVEAARRTRLPVRLVEFTRGSVVAGVAA